MPREFRVFLASPADVGEERTAMGGVLDELNRTQGETLDYRAELVRWETHSAPAAGRPQGIINDDIGRYDIFVGVMWRRFGTPTGVAGSGTEEEFNNAYRAWEQDQRVILMFYFSQQPFMPRNMEDLDQMRQVLVFRQSVEGKALVWNYDGPRAFSDSIRPHLYKRLDRLVRPPLVSKAEPDQDDIRILRALFSRMDEATRRAFSIAYNEKRQAGDGGVDTETLFAALRRAEKSNPVISAIARRDPEALPPEIEGPIVTQPYIVQEQPWLSGCVSESIKRLSRHLPPGREVTGTDIFVDIAKHGTGGSVLRLRKHDIGPAEIDQIVRDTGVSVLAT
jgi:hypothetical protein